MGKIITILGWLTGRTKDVSNKITDGTDAASNSVTRITDLFN